jgi:hypothetical protein
VGGSTGVSVCCGDGFDKWLSGTGGAESGCVAAREPPARPTEYPSPKKIEQISTRPKKMPSSERVPSAISVSLSTARPKPVAVLWLFRVSSSSWVSN